MLPLEQARMAIQQGDRAKARAILANLVKIETQNSDAWLLLAEVLDNPQQASYCRERAQFILKARASNKINPSGVSQTSKVSTYNERNRIQVKCPFCAEMIPSDAVVCPYCKMDLSKNPTLVKNSLQQPNQTPVNSKSSNSYGTNVVLAVVVSIVVICGCMLLGGAFEGVLDRVSSYEVRYEVIGSTRGATISWINSQGGMEQGDYNLPFREIFSFERGEIATIVAQNYFNSGNITCQIWVNDVLWRESKSSGAYSIVTCSGIIGEP